VSTSIIGAVIMSMPATRKSRSGINLEKKKIKKENF
jgi:hypothetical protein